MKMRDKGSGDNSEMGSALEEGKPKLMISIDASITPDFRRGEQQLS